MHHGSCASGQGNTTSQKESRRDVRTARHLHICRSPLGSSNISGSPCDRERTIANGSLERTVHRAAGGFKNRFFCPPQHSSRNQHEALSHRPIHVFFFFFLAVGEVELGEIIISSTTEKRRYVSVKNITLFEISSFTVKQKD